MTDIDPKIWSELRLSLQAANHSYATDGREGFISTLQAFVSFCVAVPELQAGLTPLVAGLSAITDLDVGAVSPIVTPKVFGNRPPELGYHTTVKGTALACANVLRRYGMPRSQADARVARHLEKIGFPLGGRSSSSGAKVLKGWRESLSRDKEEHCQLTDSFSGFEELLRTRDYATAEEAWSDIKHGLDNLVTSMQPALKKAPM